MIEVIELDQRYPFTHNVAKCIKLDMLLSSKIGRVPIRSSNKQICTSLYPSASLVWQCVKDCSIRT
jgi:hypothetical protein